MRAPERPAVRGVRRVVRRQIARCDASLRRRWPISDEIVHDIRKRLKKARAGLRLLRGVIPRRKLRSQDRAMRDVGRSLSPIRDAKILVATWDGLLSRPSTPALRDAAGVRDLLVRDQARARRRLLPARKALRRPLQSLAKLDRLVRSWPSRGRWKDLRPGLRRVYRDGRRAMARARTDSTAENLHEWRKQSKYLWLELGMVEGLRPGALASRVKAAHRLSDRLGEDHDLAVLRDRLERPGARLPATTLEAIRTGIEARRRRLQAEAWKLGAGVYRDRPKRFARRLDAGARARRRRA